MIETEDQAREYVRELCDETASSKLEHFCIALAEENTQQNLVSRGTLNTIWQRHIADSAQLLEHTPATISLPWLDLGSGAGLPGLIVAAMRPDMPVVLVESRARRSQWLQRMVTELNLPNCKVLPSRLELVTAFDAGVISARAFAALPKLLEVAARFSTGRTIWLLPKGRSAKQELTDLPGRYGKMFHVEQSKTEFDAGIIVGHLKARMRAKGKQAAT